MSAGKMIPKIKGIGLVLLLIYFIGSPCWGATYHVAKTGSDSAGTGAFESPWLTIQKALNMVGSTISSGDVIQVHTGTYSEAPTTIAPGGSASVTLMAADMSVTVNRFSVKHSNYKFQGFNVTGTGDHGFNIAGGVSQILIKDCIIGSQGPYCGIQFADQSIESVTIDGCTFGPSNTALLPAIRIRGNHHTIKNCKFNYFHGLDSIYLISNYTTIEDNIFNSVSHWYGTTNHPDCIQADGEAFGNAHDILIQRNIFRDISGQVIRVYQGTTPGNNVYNWIVRNNVFENIGAKTIQAAGDSFYVYGNTFYGATKNTSHPVGFRNDNTNSMIMNNIFVGCGAIASSVDQGWWNHESSASKPTGFVNDCNMVAGDMASSWLSKRSGSESAFNDLNGINGGNPQLTNTNKAWVWANNNGNSYDGTSSSFEVSSSEAKQFVVGEYLEYCPFTSGCDGVARKITVVEGSLIRFSPAISNYFAPECSSSNCNTMIKLWGINDNVIPKYALQYSSPARDRGGMIAGFSDDITGAARPSGNSADIGAYEYYGKESLEPPRNLKLN